MRTKIGHRTAKAARKLAAVTGAAALLAVLTTASAQASGGPRMWLVNVNSGKCLAIGAASTAGGAGAIQWDCVRGAGEQQWYEDGFKTVGGTTFFELVNFNSGKCLADPGDSPNEGVQLIQYGCYGGEEQYWAFDDGTPVSGGQANLFSMARGCMNVAVGGASLTSGAPVIQWQCDTGNEQLWEVLYPVS